MSHAVPKYALPVVCDPRRSAVLLSGLSAETTAGDVITSEITALVIDTGRPAGEVAVIAGRDGTQQLIVTGNDRRRCRG